MATKMEEVPCFRPELAGKTIYIIRHAQGQHNVSSRFDFDPVLTSIGLDQVQSQQALAQSLGVDLVVVSPLRRTLQTATGLFPQHEKMVAFEPLREGVTEACNLRLSVEQASAKFPQVDFSLVDTGADKHLSRFLKAGETAQPEDYQQLTEADCRIEESEKEMDNRAEQVIAFVASREEDRIALVSHCTFLRALSETCRKGAPSGLTATRSVNDYLENCEIRQLKHVLETN
mmetsp:Transcript_46196/g.108403  ORF Transcript_46196/g.108403 Transcript_46196/m.108403 type:complete len:231 (-) Transcript_46196:207-899(-)